MEQQRAKPGGLREWPEADHGLPLCNGIISTIWTVLGVGGRGCKNVYPQHLHKQGMQEAGKQVNAGVEAWRDSLSGRSGSPSGSALLRVAWALLLPKARAQAGREKSEIGHHPIFIRVCGQGQRSPVVLQKTNKTERCLSHEETALREGKGPAQGQSTANLPTLCQIRGCGERAQAGRPYNSQVQAVQRSNFFQGPLSHTS